MLLVDSTVWIDYFNGQPTPEAAHLDDLLSRERILVGDLILAEVLQGFRSEADFTSARAALLRFEQVALVTTDLAIRSAANFRALRRSGLTVRKTIDCLIATYCIEHRCPLLHRDADFDAFEKRLGLKVRRA